MQWNRINKTEKTTRARKFWIYEYRVYFIALQRSIAQKNKNNKKKKSKVVGRIEWKVYVLANDDDDDSDIGSYALGVCVLLCVLAVCL